MTPDVPHHRGHILRRANCDECRDIEAEQMRTTA